MRYVLSNAKQILKQQPFLTQKQVAILKGYIPVYVGHETEKKRYMVPLSYLSHPAFQDLLLHAEEEFCFHHPMGGLIIPCTKEAFEISFFSKLLVQQDEGQINNT